MLEKLEFDCTFGLTVVTPAMLSVVMDSNPAPIPVLKTLHVKLEVEVGGTPCHKHMY